MSNKTYEYIMHGRYTNIEFYDLCYVLRDKGFSCRIRGSHHIFYKCDIPEIINVQPKGDMAKAYQVKQVHLIFMKYNM